MHAVATMATIALQHHGAQARPWLRRLVRLGYAAKGVIYLLIGTFALQLALGDGGRITDSRGVLDYITGLPFGTPLLGMIGVGLLAYALWEITEAVLTPTRDRGASGIGHRALTAFKGLIYGGLGWKALRLAMGAGDTRSGGTESYARDALALPFGDWMLIIAGTALAAYGVVQAWHAWQGRLDDDMDWQQMHREGLGWVRRVGRAGVGARGVVFAVMGVLLAQAGLDRQPSDAGGVADALVTVLSQPFGAWLLAAVATGLVCYGVWQLLHARYARL